MNTVWIIIELETFTGEFQGVRGVFTNREEAILRDSELDNILPFHLYTEVHEMEVDK